MQLRYDMKPNKHPVDVTNDGKIPKNNYTKKQLNFYF